MADIGFSILCNVYLRFWGRYARSLDWCGAASNHKWPLGSIGVWFIDICQGKEHWIYLCFLCVVLCLKASRMCWMSQHIHVKENIFSYCVKRFQPLRDSESKVPTQNMSWEPPMRQSVPSLNLFRAMWCMNWLVVTLSFPSLSPSIHFEVKNPTGGARSTSSATARSALHWACWILIFNYNSWRWLRVWCVYSNIFAYQFLIHEGYNQKPHMWSIPIIVVRILKSFLDAII